MQAPFEPIGRAELVAQAESAVRVRAEVATVEVTALAPDVFRVGMFGDGQPPDYRSEALAGDQWPEFDMRVEPHTDAITLTTSEAAAWLSLDPLRIGFRDREGREILHDEPRLGMGFVPQQTREPHIVPLGTPARVYKRHLPGTRYFGCGERTGGLDKTASRQVFWNVDPPQGHTASLNNLYTSVPFVIALQSGRAWGLFLDSSYRVEFDLAGEEPTRCGFGIDGGPLIYYVFCGPTPRRVLERYTHLTGRIPLPPRWALGNHQSRWGYKTSEQVLDIAGTFRERGLPCDAIYLDIDYMRGYRVFTWDPERFPDPSRLTRQLDELGVKLVTIVDPGVKVDEEFDVYISGRDRGLFCKTLHGSEYRNVVWPGLCAFPDFTNPLTRTWWGDLHHTLLDAGVAGVWCDMNEPTVFVPTGGSLPHDAAHHGDGEARLHAQVHNVYGQQMARSAYEGVRRLRPERRPMVISRSGFAGLQRYAIHWTGDNSSWWEHLWMSMPQLQNLGLSGYAWVGVDVGGFGGDATGELLTRWMEFGIFQPFCRNHSAWDTRPQEPWAFGEPYESHIRALLLLRQRLLPYLYSLFEEAHRTGAPILRPLLFEWPDDETTFSTDDEFLLGRALLVAPIARPGTEYRHVYIPRGIWVHYWSGERVAGPAHVLAHAPLGRPAIYVRANTPIPMWPSMLYDGERMPDPLTWMLFVADAEPGAFELYDDAGEGYGYEQGEFARTRAACDVTPDSVSVTLERQGAYWIDDQSVELELRGMASPEQVVVDGSRWGAWEHERDRLLVRLGSSSEGRSISIRGRRA